MKIKLAICLLSGSFLIACSDTSPQIEVADSRPDSPPKIIKGKDSRDVVQFDTGNREMDYAMTEATATLSRFFSAFKEPQSNQTRFNLKIGLNSPSGQEFVWVDDVAQDGVKFTGTLLDQPYYSQEYTRGSPLTFSLTDIVDWAYIEDGLLIGGYTLRVMFKQYPESQREEIQRQLGYKIDLNHGA